MVRQDALCEFTGKGTDVIVSFPVNVPSALAACVTEHLTPGCPSLIPMASTDGGAIPRNNLIRHAMLFHQLGYLSLEDVVRKVSLNPALVFGLMGEGHLTPGPMRNVTVVGLATSNVVLGIVGGQVSLDADGMPTQRPGRLMAAEAADKVLKDDGIPHVTVDVTGSVLSRQIPFPDWIGMWVERVAGLLLRTPCHTCGMTLTDKRAGN